MVDLSEAFRSSLAHCSTRSSGKPGRFRYPRPVKASERIVRLLVSPGGAKFDRFVVRLAGHSLVSWVFARAEGVPYNPPALLTTIGSVSGKRRTVVLPTFVASGKLCVVGSRGGLPSDPYWARNLRAEPRGWIRAKRRLRPVSARFATGEEREALWKSITAEAPIYLEYQGRARAHREIPVIVLSDA